MTSDMPPGGYEVIQTTDGGVALVWPGGGFGCDSEESAVEHAWTLWQRYSGLSREDLQHISTRTTTKGES